MPYVDASNDDMLPQKLLLRNALELKVNRQISIRIKHTTRASFGLNSLSVIITIITTVMIELYILVCLSGYQLYCMKAITKRCKHARIVTSCQEKNRIVFLSKFFMFMFFRLPITFSRLSLVAIAKNKLSS